MKMLLDNWQKSLDRLTALLNIARISLLISVITFWVLTKDAVNDNSLVIPLLNKTELYSWAIIYNGFVVFSLLVPRWQNQTEALPNARSVVDITMIAWLMQMADGVNGGFGILLLPFVCAACLLSRGRYPLLYAGYAVLLVALITFWQVGTSGLWPDNIHLLVVATILSAAIFILAMLTSYVAQLLTRFQRTQDQQSQVLDSYRHLLDRAFNDVQEGVVVLDTRCVVWLMNSKAESYFPEVRLDSCSQVFQPLLQHWQQSQDNGFEMECALGNQLMRVRARVLHEADTFLLMLFMRARNELEQEAMALKLAALGLLTANLAHEVRNPMSAIRQATGLLQEEEVNPVRLRLFGIIDNNIGRIDKMLEDIGLLSKKGRPHKQLLKLRDFWQAFYQEFVLTTPAARHCIQYQPVQADLTVWCDPSHLQQIMWNIMNNAWRHSRQDAQAIRVIFRPCGQHETAIDILDNGMGVSIDNQQHLFEPFFTTAANGTGLGLYIARELAHSNQGQLRYQTEMNGFEIILPREINA